MSYHYLQLAIVLAFCGQCSVYANVFGQPCGGTDDVAGKCDAGLVCSYINGTKGTKPGACCRTPLTETTTESNGPPIICNQVVINPCSQKMECAKGFGGSCGGPGSINGVCEFELYCWEVQDSSDAGAADDKIAPPKKSTCWRNNIAT